MTNKIKQAIEAIKEQDRADYWYMADMRPLIDNAITLANEVEALTDAYENLQQWCIDNGIETATKGE